MGGTSSKHQEVQDGCKLSLSRSVSVPTSSHRMEDEIYTKMSWKSRFFSMSQSYRRGTNRIASGVISNLKPVKEEEGELDFDDYPETSKIFVRAAGLDSEEELGAGGAVKRLLNRSVTLQPVLEAESLRRSSMPCKNFKEDRSGVKKDSMDQNLGLRLLLNPLSQSQSFIAPSRGTSFKKTSSTKESFNTRCGNEVTRRPSTRVYADDISTTLEPEWMTEASPLTEPDVPQFDPSILATFEKAVEDTKVGLWVSPQLSASQGTFSPPQKQAAREGSMLLERSLSRLKSLKSRPAKQDRPDEILPQLRAFAVLNRKPSFSKVFSLKNDTRDWSREAYLDKFVRMCPPDCEGKIVLYFTSLRGVRKTFENCFMLRLILKGFRVHIDERDVWMHSKFRQELSDVMGTALSVPRLFILGRYIGGAEEVELLHEEGILAKLLEGLPRECRQVCKVCADVRFIPCTMCSGSCKIISSNDVLERCSRCNENGLIMCPMCD